MAEPTGQIFAGYEILAKIGQGGMGTVYKARQPLLNRIVAIKFLWPHLSGDQTFVTRFIREASTAANLQHPNMVLVHTAGEHEGAYHIVMEFVEGKSLHEHIASQGRLDPREAVAITVYVCQALQYAWKKAQLIHRDIKPANIFLSTAGEVKLGDLGLAKSLGQSSAGVTLTGMAMGSPHYMSPEQARAVKDIDFRSDIYSLGCTLYHMLTGQPPYEGDDTLGIMMKQVNDPLPAIFKVWPQCPPALGRLLHRMLAKQVHQRHPSYEELIAELMAVHEKLKADAEKLPAESTQVVPIEQQPPVPPPQPEPVAAKAAPVPGKQRSPAVLYSAAAGVFGLALLAGLLWWAPWKNRAASSPATATTDHPWVNSLGMRFVPVPGTKVLFSVWETRVKDYAAYAAANSGVSDQWRNIRDYGWLATPTEDCPVGKVSWEEAKAFCAWLTGKEQQAGKLGTNQVYRLPMDGEWSAAVGLTNESGSTPQEKSGKNRNEYPWGSQWPPPLGAGNFADEAWAWKHSTWPNAIDGYDDGYTTASPVGTFTPNRYGLYDLAGNVYELCDDLYDGKGVSRLWRGGSFQDCSSNRLLSSERCPAASDYRYPCLGFRVVLESGFDFTAISPAIAPLVVPTASFAVPTHALPADFPPGQWVKAAPDLSKLKDLVGFKDGWVQLHEAKWNYRITAPRSQAYLLLRNGGIRVRRQVPKDWGDGFVLGLVMPGQKRPRMLQLHYWHPGRLLAILDFHADRMLPSVTNEWNLHVSLGNKQISPPGTEFTADLTMVGNTVIGRIDGQTITATLLDRGSSYKLDVLRPDLSPFRDVEVLNLDGLSEAEALKAAGLTPGTNDALLSRQPQQTVDLLALTDPVKDRIMVVGNDSPSKANKWERRGSALVYVSDGGSGKVVAPVGIHARSYEIELEFERLSAPARLHADLVLDTGLIVPIYIQGTGYKILGGTAGEKCPEANAGRASVRLDRGANGGLDHLIVRFNDALLMDWKGDITRFAMRGEPYPQFTDPLRPSLYIHSATYKITAWKLCIFEGEAKVLR